jgi:hypothetical protein
MREIKLVQDFQSQSHRHQDGEVALHAEDHMQALCDFASPHHALNVVQAGMFGDVLHIG